MIDHFRRVFAYNAWANRQVVASLNDHGNPPPRALRWMAHIVGSEYTWLARLKEMAASIPVWPELDLGGCAEHVNALEREWREILDDLTPELLTDNVAYRNSKGEFWTSSVTDILTHVTIHSGYHRGQIAASVRDAGGSPATTDFIHAARSHLFA